MKDTMQFIIFGCSCCMWYALKYIFNRRQIILEHIEFCLCVVSSPYAAIQKDRGTGPDDVLATYHE